MQPVCTTLQRVASISSKSSWKWSEHHLCGIRNILPNAAIRTFTWGHPLPDSFRERPKKDQHFLHALVTHSVSGRRNRQPAPARNGRISCRGGSGTEKTSGRVTSDPETLHRKHPPVGEAEHKESKNHSYVVSLF